MLRTIWLVNKDAVEGVDYQLENLTQVWTLTNQQDAELVRLTQMGCEQPGYQSGPYSDFTEPHVEAFCDWYVSRLQNHINSDKVEMAAE